MKTITFTLFLCILISGCGDRYAVYRSKYFGPSIDPGNISTFSVGKFENWNIAIRFSAYDFSARDSENKDNDFTISIVASTFDKEARAHKDTDYRANVKSIRISYGEKLQNEIKIEKIESESKRNGQLIFFSSAEGKVYVSPDIKSVTVLIEMEFFDEDGGSTMKTFAVPMKRKEVSFIAPIND